MKAFNQLSQSAVYKEDEISVTISVRGGSYGGGSEVLVVEYESVCRESIRQDDGEQDR